MSESSLPIALVVMAKAPFPGEAKTRLGGAIGPDAAAGAAAAFLRDTLRAIDELSEPLGISERLVVCPDLRHAGGLARLVGPPWRTYAQARPGLMGGIADGFDAAFARGAELVLVTDADSPLALTEHLRECVGVGLGCDLGLGPTVDGGYYLISAQSGARDRLASLLLGEAYDGATIRAATAARARALGLRVGIGPEGFDVDTRADLDALRTRLRDLPGRFLCATRAALASLDREALAASGEVR